MEDPAEKRHRGVALGGRLGPSQTHQLEHREPGSSDAERPEPGHRYASGAGAAEEGDDHEQRRPRVAPHDIAGRPREHSHGQRRTRSAEPEPERTLERLGTDDGDDRAGAGREADRGPPGTKRSSDRVEAGEGDPDPDRDTDCGPGGEDACRSEPRRPRFIRQQPVSGEPGNRRREGEADEHREQQQAQRRQRGDEPGGEGLVD